MQAEKARTNAERVVQEQIANMSAKSAQMDANIAELSVKVGKLLEGHT